MTRKRKLVPQTGQRLLAFAKTSPACPPGVGSPHKCEVCRVTFATKSGLTGHYQSRQHAEALRRASQSPPCLSPAPKTAPKSSPVVLDVESGEIPEVPEVFFVLPQPKEATKKAPKKVGQVKKKCLDGRKGAKKRHQWEFVTQDPCSIDLSVLQSHQAPSPILVIDLSVLLFHHAPSPSLVIDLSVLLFHHAPSPISVIDLSVLLFHQAPSPILSG